MRSLIEAVAIRQPSPPAYAGGAPGPARVLLRGERSGAGLLGRFARIAREAPRGAGILLAGALIIAVGAFGCVRGGQYSAFVASHGSLPDFAARAFGFDIAIVTISGQSELGEQQILADAGVTPLNSLLFLDAAETRRRLEAVPLVKQASVRKLYPNHLIINLVERTPFALWQKDGEINVVSSDGAVIDKMRDQRFSGLPFVVGEGADKHLAEYSALVAAANELGPRIRAGVYVGGRRWTLKMISGVDVLLPEVDPLAAMAVLVRLQRADRVLERDVISLDFRVPGRMFARLTEEAAATRAAAMAQKKKGGAT